MAKIISFGWTHWALVARQKTVTRRDWKPAYAMQFKAGETLQAYDRSPRAKGRRIGMIKLTKAPYLECTSKMPKADYQREGLEYLDANPCLVPPGHSIDFDRWKESAELLYVVRFEVLEIDEHSLKTLEFLLAEEFQ